MKQCVQHMIIIIITGPNPEVSPVPLQQIAVRTKAVKPTPKPRKQKPQTPPPYRRPIQESSEHMTQLLCSPVATTEECNYDQQRKSHGMPRKSQTMNINRLVSVEEFIK